VPSVSRTEVQPEASAGAVRDVAMWTSAQDGGDVEDLAALAVHEGAAGLIEAAAEPALRLTAIRAMAFARGWAQVPFLAQTACESDGAAASNAAHALIELAARPRRAEDVEETEELRAGCGTLTEFVRDGAKDKARRAPMLRALRMLPCPKTTLPTELDAR
jgi:hypothetical protein